MSNERKHGGARPGAGRKPKAQRQVGIRPWVPIRDSGEAAYIMEQLTPEERRARLLGLDQPATPAREEGGAIFDFGRQGS